MSAADNVSPTSWMYTGALENHPQIVDSISRKHRLWGNGAAVLERVRNPFLVAETFRTAGLEALAVRSSTEPPPADSNWLLKPLRCAGGRGIRVWNRKAAASISSNPDCYFQQRVRGRSVSALYLASANGAILVGVSEQFVGKQSLNARLFAYCGSMGPLRLNNRRKRRFAEIGDTVARSFDLRGLFGCDCIVNRDGIWVVEVNPRYTASVELYEHAHRVSLLDWHRRLLQGSDGTFDREIFQNSPRSVIGKSILYAPRRVTLTNDGLWQPTSDPWQLPLVADIPAADSIIEPQHPVCTIFASGKTFRDCSRQLIDRTRQIAMTLQTVDAAPVG